MIAQSPESFADVFSLFFDGFFALMAVALVAPLLGVLLVLRKPRAKAA